MTLYIEPARFSEKMSSLNWSLLIGLAALAHRRIVRVQAHMPCSSYYFVRIDDERQKVA